MKYFPVIQFSQCSIGGEPYSDPGILGGPFATKNEALDFLIDESKDNKQVKAPFARYTVVEMESNNEYDCEEVSRKGTQFGEAGAPH